MAQLTKSKEGIEKTQFNKVRFETGYVIADNTEIKVIKNYYRQNICQQTGKLKRNGQIP